jgi:hypothetical protein
MSLLEVCQSIEAMPVSAAVRESTWGFPILGALHVLALAWFGGAILVSALERLGRVRLAPESMEHVGQWRNFGVVALLVTGALLFCVEPVKCYQSISFRVKMALLVAVAVNAWAGHRARFAAGLALLLWIAIVFAARGIAYF